MWNISCNTQGHFRILMILWCYCVLNWFRGAGGTINTTRLLNIPRYPWAFHQCWGWLSRAWLPCWTLASGCTKHLFQSVRKMCIYPLSTKWFMSPPAQDIYSTLLLLDIAICRFFKVFGLLISPPVCDALFLVGLPLPPGLYCHHCFQNGAGGSNHTQVSWRYYDMICITVLLNDSEVLGELWIYPVYCKKQDIVLFMNSEVLEETWMSQDRFTSIDIIVCFDWFYTCCMLSCTVKHATPKKYTLYEVQWREYMACFFGICMVR